MRRQEQRRHSEGGGVRQAVRRQGQREHSEGEAGNGDESKASRAVGEDDN